MKVEEERKKKLKIVKTMVQMLFYKKNFRTFVKLCQINQLVVILVQDIASMHQISRNTKIITEELTL